MVNDVKPIGNCNNSGVKFPATTTLLDMIDLQGYTPITTLLIRDIIKDAELEAFIWDFESAEKRHLALIEHYRQLYTALSLKKTLSDP